MSGPGSAGSSSLPQASSRQRSESIEVSVLREQLTSSMFEAHGCDLCVEYQIPPRIAFLQQLIQDGQKAVRRNEETSRGTLEKRHDGRGGLGRRRRWFEQSRMRHDPDELDGAKDGQAPGLETFREIDERVERGLVQRHLFAGGVDEDVGVDRDQRRPSMTS